MSETEDEGALRDVERQMAADRQNELVRKFTPAFIAFGVLATVGVAGWQMWNAREVKRAEAATAEYRAVLEKSATGGDEAVAALAKFSETAPKGYAALADLRRAGTLAVSDGPAALALYRAIVANGETPRRLRDVARLRAGYLAFADGRDAVLKDLGALPDDASALGALARELSALAAFEAGDYEGAAQTFQKLATDPDASDSLKRRAEGLASLAVAAKAGVNVKGEVRAGDLARTLGLGGDPAVGAEAPGKALPKLETPNAAPPPKTPN